MDKNRGLYVHIPFCKKKCKYCDFISFTEMNDCFSLYLDALREEIKEYKNFKIDTVFIGGGTPSIFSVNQLDRLFGMIYDNFNILPDCEFTIEINPKTLDKDKLLSLKKSGVNRLSIGVQSFNDNELKAIGRIHNSKTAKDTIELINDEGFKNFNIDIMLGLPHQTLQSLEYTLKTALSYNPAHISCYSLILEENTQLYEEYEKGIYKPMSDDDDRQLYYFAVEFLKKHGYKRYEISNFCKDDKYSKHNLKYWNCDEYIGVGVAAHSYINGVRFFNTLDLDEYLNHKFRKEDIQTLSTDDKIKEYIIMRLRLNDGIIKKDFKNRFGYDFYDLYEEIINKFTKSGHIIDNGKSYYLSDKGIDISNTIMCEFM